MNLIPTPHNAQPPQWRKITEEDPPQFPCWFWQHGKAIYLRDWCLDKKPSFYHVTHWHPDQPTAPEGRPTDATGFLNDTPENRAKLATPAETATPTPETDAIANVGEHAIWTPFARRLERERDQARAQLKSMTDQFLAVSGQLGEANKLLREVLAVIEQRGVGHVVMYSDRITPLLPRIRKALAQSDSPGAGVKGEKS